MQEDTVRVERPLAHWFEHVESLRRPERIALLAFVVISISLDVAGFIQEPDGDVLQRILSVAVTLTLALYAFSPVIATVILGLVVVASFLAGNAGDTLLGAALAAMLVARLGTTTLIMAYSGGLLVSTALLASDWQGSNSVSHFVATYPIIATVAGGLGLALRLAYARGLRLEQELVEQAEKEREAIRAERRWIAGELHDNIAHHLTVISLHAQLLDDDAMRPVSQDAIRTAARKALSDLRFVIRLADDTGNAAQPPSGDLAAAIDEAREEFEAAGHSVKVTGDPKDESIPLAVEVIFARIMRESATNVLKYAGSGPVEICLTLDSANAQIEIRSPLPSVPRHDLPSTGTGLNRMAERVLGISGSFSAGPVGDWWVVLARLPVAPGAPTPDAAED